MGVLSVVSLIALILFGVGAWARFFPAEVQSEGHRT